jgi:curved DNA-binding protein CbpA
MSLKDYYIILEVSRHATPVQIKGSYRRLARLYHPDLNKQAQDDHIKLLNEAYEVLSDPIKRVQYDIQLLEQMRRTLILEMIYRQHEAKMTWKEGVVGFVKELKNSVRED